MFYFTVADLEVIWVDLSPELQFGFMFVLHGLMWRLRLKQGLQGHALFKKEDRRFKRAGGNVKLCFW